MDSHGGAALETTPGAAGPEVPRQYYESGRAVRPRRSLEGGQAAAAEERPGGRGEGAAGRRRRLGSDGDSEAALA